MPPVRVELTPDGLRVHRSALLSYGGGNGGADETRTRYLTVDNRALCPLSYDPFELNSSNVELGGPTGLKPATPAVTAQRSIG
jgi:hypothetical protein